LTVGQLTPYVHIGGQSTVGQFACQGKHCRSNVTVPSDHQI